MSSPSLCALPATELRRLIGTKEISPLELLDAPLGSGALPPVGVRERSWIDLPIYRGDTSRKVLKPASLKTEFMVQVPLFCATGDKIEIDTRTGEYRRRV